MESEYTRVAKIGARLALAGKLLAEMACFHLLAWAAVALGVQSDEARAVQRFPMNMPRAAPNMSPYQVQYMAGVQHMAGVSSKAATPCEPCHSHWPINRPATDQ